MGYRSASEGGVNIFVLGGLFVKSWYPVRKLRWGATLLALDTGAAVADSEILKGTP